MQSTDCTAGHSLGRRPPGQEARHDDRLEWGGIVAALLLICITGASAARADRAGTVDAGDLTTADGQKIYSHICQGCHMPQGQGAEGAGHYPALAGNPALVSWQYMALTIIKGRRNMPASPPNTR